ncbi:MAG: RnfH family protein [Methylomonas sp.]|nr:MAG: RnfH family protein [Methylomonas sp.]
MADALISVEVAYAKPDRQNIISLILPIDSTAQQAILASGILQQFPEIDLSLQKIGIFGQACKLDKPLTDGDRIEIYRPLQQHPMEARRYRVSK